MNNNNHFVILNLFQDLNGILKRVQNDSERQNGLDKKNDFVHQGITAI